MYNVNDVVVYSSYGVCEISAIEERDFSGENVEYYVLRPVGDSRNTFYVPTSKSTLIEQMRRVYTREEVEQLIKNMSAEDFIWIDDDAQRKERYRAILSGGDRTELVRLIKTLYIRRQELVQQHKKLHSSDEKFLEDAENVLYDEFAYALGISREEVVPYIKEHV